MTQILSPEELLTGGSGTADAGVALPNPTFIEETGVQPQTAASGSPPSVLGPEDLLRSPMSDIDEVDAGPTPAKLDTMKDLDNYGLPQQGPDGLDPGRREETINKLINDRITIQNKHFGSPEATAKIDEIGQQIEGLLSAYDKDTGYAKMRQEEKEGIPESNVTPWEWFGSVGGAKALTSMGKKSIKGLGPARSAMNRGMTAGAAAVAVDAPLEVGLDAVSDDINPWVGMFISLGVGIPAGNFAETYLDHKTLRMINKRDKNFFKKNMDKLKESDGNVSEMAQKNIDELASRMDEGDILSVRKAQEILNDQNYKKNADMPLEITDYSPTGVRAMNRKQANRAAMKKSFRDVDDKDIEAINNLADIDSYEGFEKEFKTIKKRAIGKLAGEAYEGLPAKDLFYRIIRAGGLPEERMVKTMGQEAVDRLKKRNPKLISGTAAGGSLSDPVHKTVTGKAYLMAARSTDAKADIAKFRAKAEEIAVTNKKLLDEQRWDAAMEGATKHQMYQEAIEALEGKAQHAKGLAKAKAALKGSSGIDPIKLAVDYDYNDMDDMVSDLINMPTLKNVKASVARNMAYDWNVLYYDEYAKRTSGTELEMWKKMGASDTVKRIRSAIRRDQPEITEDAKSLGNILSETAYMRRVGRNAVVAAEKKTKGESRVKQLLKSEKYKDAAKLKKEVIQIHGNLRNAMKNRGIPEEYQEQIHNYLKPYFGGRALSGEGVMGLRYFLDEKALEGLPLAKLLRDEFEDILELPLSKKDIKDLTLGEYRRMKDFMHNFQRMAKNQKNVDNVSQGQAINEYVGDIQNKADETWGRTKERGTQRQEMAGQPSWFKEKTEAASDAMGKPFSTLKRAEFIMRELDGWEDFGPAQKMFQAAKHSEDVNNRLNGVFQDRWKGVMDKYASRQGMKKFPKDFWTEKLHDSMGYFSATREEMITMKAMSGNPQNKQAMLNSLHKDGEPLSEVVFNRFMRENMTPDDEKLVEDMWEMTDEMYPMLAEKYKKMTGRTLPKVKNYFPIIPDYKFTKNTPDQSLSDVYMDLPHMQKVKPNVQKRFLHERSGGASGIKMNFDALAKHFNDVSHTVSHWEETSDIYKVIHDKKFKDTVESNLGKNKYKVLTDWIDDLIKPPRSRQPKLRAARGAFTIGTLGYKLSTAMVQPLSMISAIPRVGKDNLALSLSEFMQNPRQFKKGIDQLSPQMANRSKSWNKEIKEFMETSSGKKFKKMKGIDRDMFFSMIRMGDTLGAYNTWYAGWLKGMKKYDGNSNKAVAYADQSVRLTQPQSSLKDLPKIMRSENEWNRLISMFYSYYSVLHNQGAEVVNRMRKGNMTKSEAMSALNYMYIVPPIIKTLTQERTETTPTKLAQGVATHVAGGIPIARDIVSSKVMGYDYKISPVQNIPEAFIKAADQLQKQIMDEDAEFDIKKAAPFVEALGYALRMPSSQIIQMMRTYAESKENEEINLLDYLIKKRTFDDK